jgi:hypothetical protein
LWVVSDGDATLPARKRLQADCGETLRCRDKAKGAVVLAAPPNLVSPSCRALFRKAALQERAEASLENLALCSNSLRNW